MKAKYNKNYKVVIDTDALSNSPDERMKTILNSVTPVINQIFADAMTLAIGTWPTPEKDPTNQKRERT